MSIHIHQIEEYLDNNLIVKNTDSVESLMEILHDAYLAYNTVDSEGIREKFAEFRNLLTEVPAQQFDALFTVVCDLCISHEVLAFSQGVAVGMGLMTEVNRLP